MCVCGWPLMVACGAFVLGATFWTIQAAMRWCDKLAECEQKMYGENGPPPTIEMRPDPPPAPPSPYNVELDDIQRRLKELETDAVIRAMTQPPDEIKGDPGPEVLCSGEPQMVSRGGGG